MKNKVCMICKGTIEKGKHEYVVNEHIGLKGETKSKGWYHYDCFLQRLRGSQIQNKVGSKALELFNKIGEKL